MNKLLIHLRDTLGLELDEREQAGVLTIRKSGGVAFRVTVPYDVLIWFVDACDDSGEIWSDWADYSALHEETREQLARDMAADIERVATMLAGSQVRVVAGVNAAGKKGLELQRADSWEDVSIIWGDCQAIR